MKDYSGYNEFDDQRARNSALEFEEMLKSKEFYFLDLVKLDEIYNYYLNNQSLDKAGKLLSFAIKSHPANSELYFRQAQLQFETESYGKALRSIDYALRFSPHQFEFLLLKAEILGFLKHFDEAINILEELLPVAETPEDVYLHMGHIARICGRITRIEPYLRKALAIAPDCEEALYELAFLFESQSRWNDCVSLYDRFLEENPYAYYAWYNLSLVHGKTGNFERAVDTVEYSLAIRDDFASAWFHKGQMLMNMENYPAALQALLEVLTLEGEDPATLYHIGECYENEALYSRAFKYYLRATEEDPDYMNAWIGCGFSLEKLEKYLEAVHFYQKAHEVNPESTDALLSLSICEYKLGNEHSAYDCLQKAISLDPNDLNIWQDWAQLLADQGNPDGAVSFLEEGIRANPTLSELYFQCAAYAFEADRTDRALALLENGLLLDYENHYILFHYASDLAEDSLIAGLIKQYS
jgi:tetratricopeptide (TPR) repeat protein